MSQDFQKPDEAIAETLSRESVSDLIEQTAERRKLSDELFYKSTEPIEIIEHGQINLMDYWKVRSGGRVYEVRGFKAKFWWCQCLAFFFKKTCKHVSRVRGVACSNCFQLSAKVGKLCHDCHVKATGFLRPSRPASIEAPRSL